VANLQLYTLLFCSADGVLLAEEVQITLTRTTNSQPVNTVAKGYAGESQGAPMQEFDVDSAIPAGGFEFDAGQKMLALATTDLFVIGPGGTVNRGKAFIISDVTKHGVNQEASYTFRARAPMALFS
jgi:hypothetical protein